MKRVIYFLVLISLISACKSSKHKEGLSMKQTVSKSQPGELQDFECKFTYNAIDYRLNEHRAETEYEKLFNFTHLKLKEHFTDKHFMEAYASSAQLGETNYIYLKIFFNTLEIEQSYGSIPKDENMRIILLNGEKLYLENISSSYPKLSKKTGQTIYDCIFKAGESDFDLLKKHEIDKLGIVWAQGYEEYEVSNIDLIKNQIHCLNQNLN